MKNKIKRIKKLLALLSKQVDLLDASDTELDQKPDTETIPDQQYNTLAVTINDKIGTPIFNELVLDKLVPIKYSKKEIKQKQIDDLITENGKITPRMREIVIEIKKGIKNDK